MADFLRFEPLGGRKLSADQLREQVAALDVQCLLECETDASGDGRGCIEFVGTANYLYLTLAAGMVGVIELAGSDYPRRGMTEIIIRRLSDLGYEYEDAD